MKLLATVAAMALAGSGCAMTFQERPPKTHTASNHCAESSPLPVIDTIVGATAMAAAVAGLYYAWGRNHEGYVLPSGATAVGGMIMLGSARSGFGWEAQCQSGAGIAAR